MARFYYATEHQYDVRFCSDHMTLYRFESMEARDGFVEARNDNEAEKLGHYLTESLNWQEARHHYPHAFKMVGDFHEVSDERDWLEGKDGVSKMVVSYWSEGNFWNRAELGVYANE